MAKTSGEFLSYIRGSGYPRSLTDAAVLAAFDLAIIDISVAAPMIKTGTFQTVISQSTYDIFNRADSDPVPDEMVDPLGIRVYDAIWSIQGSSATDPFYQGSGFGPYNGRPTLPFTVVPGRSADSIIFELDNEAIIDEFFMTGWEHVDGDPGSSINLLPTPTSIYTVAVRYSTRRPLEDYIQRAEYAYTAFAESRCCRAIAREAGMVAGTRMGTFEDTGKSADFWRKEADRLRDEAKNLLQLVGFSEVAAVSRGGTVS